MFNLKFNNIEECKKNNNMSDAEVLNAIKKYFENQNYREGYNKRKNALTKLLANDPVVVERMKALSGK